MNSRLYRGTVWHSRSEPAYRFQYRVWYLGLDLAETDRLDADLRLFSHNRFNVLAVHDRDYLHLTEPGSRARDDSSRTELITLPRLLGHAFNPVSFFVHRSRENAITHVDAEVHNTWGERHVYALVHETQSDGAYSSTAGKAFYVSPFLPMQGGYRFELREDDDGRLRISIALQDPDGQPLFSGGIDVQPAPLSDAGLARMLLAYPFVNLKTVAMIHWQGLKLWLRGVRFLPNPSRTGTKRRQLWSKGP